MGQQCRAYRYNHVIVVEEHIDPSQDEQVEWAFAHRVNAGEGRIIIFPGILVLPFFSDKAHLRCPGRQRASNQFVHLIRKLRWIRHGR